MHRLDNHIRDIEPRIEAIYNNAPKQEEASLQESLSSYGWILLDSWVAWRTLRFVLKDAKISQDIHEKWFQTPSSYNASQLKAVWRFREADLNYLEIQTGKKFKGLIDETIQKKRNSCAHFTKQSSIPGQDSQEIKLIFKSLSKLFLLYETNAFLDVVINKLLKYGYYNYIINFENGNTYSLSQFKDSIDDFFHNFPFTLNCQDLEHKYFVEFTSHGCEAGIIVNERIIEIKSVINDEQNPYMFFSNKGYYQNVDLFVETIKNCWLTS